jgi:hypothetical protein
MLERMNARAATLSGHAFSPITFKRESSVQLIDARASCFVSPVGRHSNPSMARHPACEGSTGGIISYIPSSQDEAVQKSFACFKEKLEDLAGRIDAEIVRKEDFAELYNSYKRTTSHTNRDEKLRAAANILANFFLKPVDPAKSSFQELDHLLHCVDTLSAGAIAVLGAARKIPHHTTRCSTRSLFERLFANVRHRLFPLFEKR